MSFLPDAVLLPCAEKLVNRLVEREFMRQHAPRAARFEQVEHGIDALSLIRAIETLPLFAGGSSAFTSFHCLSVRLLR
jgi:hypothetical protein